ncbi:MAG: AgmX/PglI C-terminal domain-containing protein [Bacteriovorax sp.]|nr:AgmX/PglI C-terminal domain-containing protein [Bacteriovorax sp.]
MTTNNQLLRLPRRNFVKNESHKHFFRNAVLGSFFLHAFLFFVKFPNEHLMAPAKQKLAALKMQFITPPKSYRILKNTSAKTDAMAGNLLQSNSLLAQKSKAGSPKVGALSHSQSQKGYQFKASGLKALMGDSSTMTLASGSNSESASSQNGGSGSAVRGNNLNGEYRAPAGIGVGNGHLLGKDSAGNFDRSSATKGLSQKKGIDTAFVQPETVVLGAIDPEVLRKILGEYLAQFKFCYQQELQEQSEKIKGVVDLHFRIEGDGKVSKISIKSAQTQFSDRAIGCMSNVLRMIDFPHPRGGGLVDIRQPLNFFSENTKI